MASHLPTLTSASWTITALRDSLIDCLSNDRAGIEIQMFFYAVTESGWRSVRKEFLRWLTGNANRRIVAYVGTDHAITEADAIQAMVGDGVNVRLMTSYRGIFHPKIIWLRGPNHSIGWVGSNNLTRDGLLNNVEFAAMLTWDRTPRGLRRWAKLVHGGSTAFTPELLEEYQNERREYAKSRVKVGTFTWSRREKSDFPRSRRRPRGSRTLGGTSHLRRGDLIIEIMPRETGQDGKQIQLPMAAATGFFGLEHRVGASRVITLSPAWVEDRRDLTMTIFGNRTVRLVINELDYRDRPCVLLFKRRPRHLFTFDIVSRTAFPARYRQLINECDLPTRHGSRRWSIIR